MEELRQGKLKIKNISIEEKTITDRKLSSTWIKRLRNVTRTEGKQPSFPLIAQHNGNYYALGGRHTIEALKAELGEDAEIVCRIIPWGEEREMFVAAVCDNSVHGKPYSRRELNAIRHKLRSYGYTARETDEIMGVSEEKADTPGKILRMEASNLETPIKKERANKPESPNISERARISETPNMRERATEGEIPNGIERVKEPETPTLSERASVRETPTAVERATENEIPIQAERATSSETPRPDERPDIRAIRFHVGRLCDLLPSSWTEARIILGTFSEMIEALVQEGVDDE